MEKICLSGKLMYRYGLRDEQPTGLIELEPPDISKLKEGDTVLVRCKLTRGWYLNIPKENIVAILPKEEKYIKCKNCGAISPKNYKLCYCGKDKEQPKEMPFVKQYGDCEEACIERIIKCVEDLQERVKKMEEK